MSSENSPGVSVELVALSKHYGDVVAVDQCDLRIEAGEFVALLGPSGSGKTTMLMSIAGFESPTSGRVLLGDKDVTSLPPRRRNVGVVFQQYALFPHMTVAQNIAYGLRQRKVPKDQVATKVDAALALVSLTGYGARKISELSGGQQQRVAMARASVYEPPVMLMDEPLGALDRQLREQLQVELKSLQRRLGTTFVFVTHDQAEALTMADRIAVISDGVVQQFGTAAELYEEPANLFVARFVGQNNFLDGKLELLDSETARLACAQGGSLLVDRRNVHDDLLPSGGAATAAIRPESLALVPRSGDGPVGSVMDITYEGSTTATVARMSDGIIVTARSFRLDSRAKPEIGDEIELTAVPAQVRVFAASENAQ